MLQRACVADSFQCKHLHIYTGFILWNRVHLVYLHASFLQRLIYGQRVPSTSLEIYSITQIRGPKYINNVCTMQMWTPRLELNCNLYIEIYVSQHYICTLYKTLEISFLLLLCSIHKNILRLTIYKPFYFNLRCVHYLRDKCILPQQQQVSGKYRRGHRMINHRASLPVFELTKCEL